MITPINNVFFNNKVSLSKPQFKPNLTLRPQLSADTVSFGNSRPDLMSLPDSEILKKIQNAIKKEVVLGEGGEATVYKIPGSNYCVRKYYLREDSVPLLKRQITRNVSEQDKINHVVARCGNDLTIMPIIKGSVIYSPITMNEPQASELADEIGKFPQSSFNKLLKQISDAYEKDMMWDCNWANLIADTSSKKLTAIDFCKNELEESASHLAYMFASLVHEYSTEQQCKVFAQKIMNAGLEEFKPGVVPCCGFDKFGFSDIIRSFDELNLFTSKNYTKLLLDLTYKIRDLKVQEMRGKNVTNELNDKIKTVQAIMRQLVKY